MTASTRSLTKHTYSRIFGVHLILGSILPRNSTDTRCSKLVVGRIDDIGRAQSLVAILLPLGNQSSIHQFLIQAVLVDLSRNLLVLVKHVINIARLLPVDLMDRPERLVLSNRQVAFLDLVAEFVFEGLQDGLNVVKAWRRSL